MKRTNWLFLAALLPSVSILVLHARQYLPFLSDDALISLRYANRLLDGHGLTWTAGHPVEGYSNLLWILLVALLGRVGVDLIAAARILGVLGMATIMAALALWYSRKQPRQFAWFPIAVGLLFLALGAPIAVWAIGGLEQPLYGALIAASIPLMYSVIDRETMEFRRTGWLSLVLGLLCVTRPDGPIFATTAAFSLFAAGWLHERPRPVSHALLVLLFPVGFSLGQSSFRWVYYGELVPNTALVKIAASPTHRTFGIEYLSSGFAALFPFSTLAVIALLAMLVVRKSRGKGICLSTAAMAWSAYVVFIGGDIFPAYRHLVPLMVIMAFALAEGASLLAQRLAARPLYFYPAALAVLLAFVPYARGQSADKWNARAVTERWEWQGKGLGLLLKDAFGRQQPLVAVTAAGCLPYWSELPALDMMGLNDYYLPRHRPANFGEGMVGHELGDGQYVLSQKPDLIIFDVGSPQPSWRTGEELNKLPEFRSRYVPITVRIKPDEAQPGMIEYSPVIYVDKNSDRIGISRSPSTLTVPGYLFAGGDAVAFLNTASALVARVSGTHAAQVTIDADPGLQWSVDATASGLTGLEIETRQEGPSLTITLRSIGPDVDVERVVLRGSPAIAAGAAARR